MLVEQYQAAKWNINVSTAALNSQYLSPTDSVLVDTYLEALSQTSNISLLASNNITVANLSDNLLALGARSLTMTATSGNITFADVNDMIRTEGRSITMTAGGTMTLGHLNTTGASGALGATVTLNAGGNITANSISGTTATLTSNTGSLGNSGDHIDTTITTAVLSAGGGAYIRETNALVVDTSNITGAFTVSNNTAATDITIQNTNVGGNTSITSQRNITADTNNTFGTLTATGNGTISIYENAGNININSITNNSATGTTGIWALNGDVIGKGTAVADINAAGTGLVAVIAGDNVGDTGSDVNVNVNTGGPLWVLATGNNGSNRSIRLTGDVAGGLLVGGYNGGYTTSTGHLVLGDATDALNVTGTTTFSAANTRDVTGIGSFGGTITGSAGRVGLYANSGNITSAGITAAGSTGWNGASDETLILQAASGDILGSGFTTTGAGNIRLQAGSTGDIGAGYAVDVDAVSANQNASFYATGANGGISIRVDGGSNVAGHVTASGFNAANNWTQTTGDINMTFSSGNINTAMLWGGDDINLDASAGSIIGNNVYGLNDGETIYSQGSGNISLRAGGGYIDAGVNSLGAAGGYENSGNILARASGQNGGGVSVNLFGGTGGNVTVYHTSGSATGTTGDVFLGTTIGDPDDLNDGITMDVLGNTWIRSNGDVGLYGMFVGDVTIFNANAIVGVADKLDLVINNVNASNNISLTSLRGNITGAGLNGSNITLQAC